MSITDDIELKSRGTLVRQSEPTDSKYSCFNTGGVECSVGEFLYGLVRMIKPTLILETGTHWGISSSYMAAGLKDNNWGKIITIEFDQGNHERAKLLHSQLELSDYIQAVLGSSEAYDPEGKYFELIFLDTEPQIRFQEFLRFWKNLKPGGFIIIHDLHPGLGQTGIEINGMMDWPFGTMPQEMKDLITSHQLQSIHPRTPRGFYLIQKADTDFYSTKLLCETK